MDRNISFSNVKLHSICNKIGEIFHHIIKRKLDSCCIAETWLDDSNPRYIFIKFNLNIPSYAFIVVLCVGKFQTGRNCECRRTEINGAKKYTFYRRDINNQSHVYHLRILNTHYNKYMWQFCIYIHLNL